MTGQARVFNLKFGKHSSTSDLTSTPGTLVQLEPVGDPGFKPVARMNLERGSMNAAAKFFAPRVGPLELGSHNLELEVRGMSGNNGGAIASATTTEIGLLMDVLTGTAAVDPSGSSTTASGGTTTGVTVVSGTNIADGSGILFSNGTDMIAREVVSGGTTTSLVVDRTHGGTATGTVYRAAKWTIDPSIANHIHGYFAAEGEDYERLFFGCMGTGKLVASVNDYVKLVSTWMPNNVTDSAEDNPTFTAPTAGNAIVAVASSFYIGSTAYTFRDLEVDFGGTVTPRQAHNGAQGVHGYGVFNKVPKITGKLYLGAISGLGEITDSGGTMDATIGQGTDLAAGAARASHDIGIQLGNVAGACMYLRAPAASFTKFEKTTIDGFDGYSFELSCYGPSSGSPLRIHLF